MKTQFLFVALLFIALLTLNSVNAAEEKVSKDQVPKAVLEAFEKAYPNAKKVKFEKEMIEGKAAYEAEYKENGKEYEILYNAEGVVLQKEESIDVKTLPETIIQAITKAYPKATIEEAEKIMTPDGAITGYEVEIKTEGEELELELDTTGKILKTERD